MLPGWIALNLLSGLLSGCTQHTAGESAVELFDGETLQGWHQLGDAQWRVEAGQLLADHSSGDGTLVTDTAFRNFRLTLEFRADERVNSGVFIRCGDHRDISPDSCYEINIWDNHPNPEFRTGAIVRHISPPLVHVDTIGTWSVYEIIAQGDRITASVNGEVTAQLQDAAHQQGYIALQKANGGEIRFRNIRIESWVKGAP